MIVYNYFNYIGYLAILVYFTLSIIILSIITLIFFGITCNYNVKSYKNVDEMFEDLEKECIE